MVFSFEACYLWLMFPVFNEAGRLVGELSAGEELLLRLRLARSKPRETLSSADLELLAAFYAEHQELPAAR
jgi:hypothetical protein